MIKLLVAGAGLSVLTAASFAQGSSLPPSHPGAALKLGYLDAIVPPESANGLFVCTSSTFVLRFNDPNYNTKYYKFDILTSKARLAAKMRETPDASLWFVLRDRNLKQIREFKGGDDQLAEVELPSGSYYLQLVTDASQRRRPDGSNLAEITFRAFPSAYISPRPVQPIDLGALSDSNRAAKHNGALAAVRHRQFPYPIAEGKSRPCPVLPGSERIHTFNEYIFTAPAGPIFVSARYFNRLNWPTSQFGIFRRVRDVSGIEQWEPVGSRFVHLGGAGRLAVGYVGAATIIHNDRYIEYELRLNR